MSYEESEGNSAYRSLCAIHRLHPLPILKVLQELGIAAVFEHGFRYAQFELNVICTTPLLGQHHRSLLTPSPANKLPNCITTINSLPRPRPTIHLRCRAQHRRRSVLRKKRRRSPTLITQLEMHVRALAIRSRGGGPAAECRAERVALVVAAAVDEDGDVLGRGGGG